MTKLYLNINDSKFQVEGIIFDKDGTLLDNQYFWPKLLDYRMEGLQKEGIKKRIIEKCRKTLGEKTKGLIDPDGPIALASREDEIIATATVLYQEGFLWDEGRLLVEQVYNQVEGNMDINEISKAYEGAYEVLKIIKNKGIMAFIATSDTYERTIKMLAQTDLLKFIDLVVARDLVKEGKPKPDMIKHISGKMNIKSDKLIMVGDTLADMEMAKNAGVQGFGVLTGSGRKSILEKEAVCILNSVKDFKEFII